MDGAGCGGSGGDRDGAGSVCTETGGLGAGETGGAGPGAVLGEPGPSGDRQGRPDTGTGLGGPERERDREEPRGPGRAKRDPARKRGGGGYQAEGCTNVGPAGVGTGTLDCWGGVCGGCVGLGRVGVNAPRHPVCRPGWGPLPFPSSRLCHPTGGNWADWRESSLH